MSVFADHQQEYADRGIATFPVIVAQDKRPLIRGYGRIGLRGSNQLRSKDFADNGLACIAGPRNKVTVLDIDAQGAEADRLLADAAVRYGDPKVVSRTGSGGLHAWYRHNGEGRQLRIGGNPIDLLGEGMVVLPPSYGACSRYEFVHGKLDDFACLEPIRDVQTSNGTHNLRRSFMREGDGRNNDLFKTLGQQARRLALDLNTFIAQAHEINRGYSDPMRDQEVIKIAQSVYRYAEADTLRFGRRGAWFDEEDAVVLARDRTRLLSLLTFLKATNGPDATFMVADGLGHVLGWPARWISKARRAAIEGNWIVQVKPPAKGSPALYRWGRRAVRKNN